MKHVRSALRPLEPVSHDPELLKRVLLRAGEVAGMFQLAHCRLPAGCGTSPHAHSDMTEVFIVVGGRGSATVGTRRVRLEQFDCVVVGPGERHRLRAASDSALELLYFGLPRETRATNPARRRRRP